MSLLLTTLPSLLISSVAFIALYLLIQKHVRNHGPISGMSKVMKFHNCIYSVLSGLFFLAVAASLFDSYRSLDISERTIRWKSMLLKKDDGEIGWLRYIYHLSKIYEYQDALFVLASGGEVGLHFRIHHLTTPYLSYSRVIQQSSGWELLAALNTLHHFFMYAYFGSFSVFRPIIPLTGFLQLIIGIAGEMYIIDQKVGSGTGLGDTFWPHMFSAGLLTTYLGLFARELGFGAYGREEKIKERKD